MSDLKKRALLLMITLLSIISLTFLVKNGTCNTSQIQVERVDHTITPLYGGLLLINDTICISPIVQDAMVEEFSIGFPLGYEANLLYAMAYDTLDPKSSLDVTLDTGMGVLGYYGITVSFPDEVTELIYGGESYNFTVVFAFSDLVQSSREILNATGEYLFIVDFPLFPSLVYSTTCNVTVILPQNATYGPSELPFSVRKIGDNFILNYSENVSSFADKEGRIRFAIGLKDEFSCFSIQKLHRDVVLDGSGHIFVSESILMKSTSVFPIDKIKIKLPVNASDLTAYNAQGNRLTYSIDSFDNETYEISLKLGVDETKSFSLDYRLDKRSSPAHSDSKSHRLNLSLLERLKVAVKSFTLKVVFPEGSVIQSFPEQDFNIVRGVYQESLTLSLSNATLLQNDEWSFTYSYSAFWASFRPTFWATTIVVIGSIIAVAWKRPRAQKPISLIMVPRETLDEFVDVYENRKRTLSEIEQAKQQAKKGKMSRRRYKIRRTTLENRVSTTNKKLASLRQKIMSSGAKYADSMRQLEVAEVELENINADVKRIEVRFKRGDISAETYRRLLEDDIRRQERAKTTIDGVLLRLKE